MTAQIHVDDIGTNFLVTVYKEDGTPLDISDATLLEIIFWKPSEATVSETPSFVTDGTDGQLKYTTTTGDLDEAGVWKIQAHIEMIAGEWNSEIKTFRVYANL